MTENETENQRSPTSPTIKAARNRVLVEHPHWRQPPADFDRGARAPAREEREISFGRALKDAAG